MKSKVHWLEQSYDHLGEAERRLRYAASHVTTDPVLAKAHAKEAMRRTARAIKALDASRKARP